MRQIDVHESGLYELPEDADLGHISESLQHLAVRISAFQEHPDNPRMHPQHNLDAIGGSIRRYKQRSNVVANITELGLVLLKGHGVYKAMMACGSEYIAATLERDDAVTALGYLVADNRTGDLSEDDPEVMAGVLRQLIDEGEDVEDVGWDEVSLKALLDGGGGPDDDDDGGNDGGGSGGVECPKCGYKIEK